MATAPVSKSARARAGATPRFVALCKTLYGESVDADQIWFEVIKSSPDQADVHAHTVSTRRARYGAGAAGGVRGVRQGGKTKVTKGYLLRTEDVDKALPKLGDLVDGTKKVMSRITGAAKPPLLPSAGAAAVKPAVPGVPKPASPSLASTGPKPGVTPPTPLAPDARKPGTGTMANRAASAIGGAVTGSQGRTGIALGAAGMLAGSKVAGGAKRVGSSQVDPYAKRDTETADVTFEGTFSKLDEDKHLAFGWASVTELNGQPIVDRQGDFITTDEIEKAAYTYVHKSRAGGDMHRRDGEGVHHVSDLVESIVFTDDKIAKMGLPHDFPRGWWVGFKVHDEDTWNLVKNHERTGFSIHGKGLRVDHDIDELMGYTA